MDNKIKNCRIHGETEFYSYYEKERKILRHCCKQCSIIKRTKQRQDSKIKAIFFLGGACKRCNYNTYAGALEFHHLDPTQKDFNFAAYKTIKWNLIEIELKKCILLCSNCHREVHEENFNENKNG